MDEELFYRESMRTTSSHVGRRIMQVLDPMKEENAHLYPTLIELFEKRNAQFLSRAFLARFSYEAASSGNWLDVLDFCAAVEILMTSMYYSNRIFDQKGDEALRDSYNNQFVCSMIARDSAVLTLSKLHDVTSHERFLQAKNLFDEANKICYEGQFLDLNVNVYSSDTDANESAMLGSYMERTYKMSASYFEKIAKIAAILGGGTEGQIEALGKFGKNYGLALQMVNDIADFVPPEDNDGTTEKNSADAYSDIRHGKLTPPVIYMLSHGDETDKDLIKSALSGKNVDLCEVTRILVRSGAILWSRRIAQKYANNAKSSLREFPIEKRRPLSLMCVMLHSNRYFKALDRYR